MIKNRVKLYTYVYTYSPRVFFRTNHNL